MLTADIATALDSYWARVREEEKEGIFITPAAEVHLHATHPPDHLCKDRVCKSPCRACLCSMRFTAAVQKDLLISEERAIHSTLCLAVIACAYDWVQSAWQIRALLFVTLLTAGIVDSMEEVEKAVAKALDMHQPGLPLSLMPPHRLLMFLWRDTQYLREGLRLLPLQRPTTMTCICTSTIRMPCISICLCRCSRASHGSKLKGRERQWNCKSTYFPQRVLYHYCTGGRISFASSKRNPGKVK